MKKKDVVIAFSACGALAVTAVAGPEALPNDSKDKEVMAAPAPSGCDWSGFYVGLHGGGQFGHSEDLDFNYQFLDEPHPFGYSESGFVGGMQVGYNWQWHWLVLGPEADLGYMNLDGSGIEPGAPGGDTRGKSSSDFYTTFRGRIGIALNCWLIYATGGGIGVNYETRVIDDCNTGNCGPDLINAHTRNLIGAIPLGAASSTPSGGTGRSRPNTSISRSMTNPSARKTSFGTALTDSKQKQRATLSGRV